MLQTVHTMLFGCYTIKEQSTLIDTAHKQIIPSRGKPQFSAPTAQPLTFKSSRLHARPDFIHEALAGLFSALLLCGVPCPQAQKARPVHFIDFLHAPAVLHPFIAGGIDVFFYIMPIRSQNHCAICLHIPQLPHIGNGFYRVEALIVSLS